MERVPSDRFIPLGQVEPGPNSRLLGELQRSLGTLFVGFARRMNATTPRDGTELTEMLSLDHVTPAQITGNVDDYGIGDDYMSIARVSSDAARDMTGLAGGTTPEASQGRVIVLVNVGAFAITLKHENASSAVANRFKFTGAADHVLAADASAILWYDGSSARWRLLGA